MALPGTKTTQGPGYLAKPTSKQLWSGSPLTQATAKPQSAAPIVQKAQPVNGGGGGGSTQYGGTTNFGGGGAGLQAPAMGAQDYLNTDDVYLAALSRYNKQFGDLEADITRRGNDYEGTFGKGIKDLGYIDNTPDIAGDETWAFDDQNTAAGRSFQSLIQDFAARGLLHSGDYLRSSDDLKANLGRQHTGMVDARNQFKEGLNSERTSGQTSRDSGIGQAKAEALARIAAQYGAV